MAEPYVDLCLDAQGQLRIELTPAGAVFAREELGLRFDPDGALPHAARERYERFGADRALAELLAYPLATGWELTSSIAVGGLVSAEAPILSDSLVRDKQGVVRWFRSIYWYSDYQIHDPVIELARHGVVVFAQECDLIFSGRSVDITRQRDDTLLLELTASGRRWLDEDEFEYPRLTSSSRTTCRGSGPMLGPTLSTGTRIPWRTRTMASSRSMARPN